LAYSGGLDTSAIVVWLVEQGYEVHAVLVDVGQNEDLEAAREKALRLGATSARLRCAVDQMCASLLPYAIGLGATYEGQYRLGTALARPFIAAEQVALARELGGATLAHGATGKGNDQIRFEHAYRSLAPECPVLAPWKTWDFSGREDLIAYLKSRGHDDHYDTIKDYSYDENLWHLSIEGGVLEQADADLDVEAILAGVVDRFAVGPVGISSVAPVSVSFEAGVPVALDGTPHALESLLHDLNHQHRFAPWAWDLILENRCTGIKSRGIYINPAARLLQTAADALARACLNKPSYDAYAQLGRDYGDLLYRGAYFSDQRVMMEAAADAILSRLRGVVTIRPYPIPYVSRIQAADSLFSHDLATFGASDYNHADANGFISLSWLGSIGRPFVEQSHGAVAPGAGVTSDVWTDQRVPSGRLVPAAS